MIITKAPESFSTYVSLVLLIANITRVYWWLIARFSTVIFCASLLMIACQTILLYVWVQLAKS